VHCEVDLVGHNVIDVQSCSIVPATLATSIPCPAGPSVIIDLPRPAGQSGWWAGSEHPWFTPPPSCPARVAIVSTFCFPYCTSHLSQAQVLLHTSTYRTAIHFVYNHWIPDIIMIWCKQFSVFTMNTRLRQAILFIGMVTVLKQFHSCNDPIQCTGVHHAGIDYPYVCHLCIHLASMPSLVLPGLPYWTNCSSSMMQYELRFFCFADLSWCCVAGIC